MKFKILFNKGVDASVLQDHNGILVEMLSKDCCKLQQVTKDCNLKLENLDNE